MRHQISVCSINCIQPASEAAIASAVTNNSDNLSKHFERIGQSRAAVANAKGSGPTGVVPLYIFHGEQFIDVNNRLESDKLQSAIYGVTARSNVRSTASGTGDTDQHSNCGSKGQNHIGEGSTSDSKTTTTTTPSPFHDSLTVGLNSLSELIDRDSRHSVPRNYLATPNDINRSILMKNNSNQPTVVVTPANCSLSPHLDKAVNRDDTKEGAKAMSSSFDCQTKSNRTSTNSSIVSANNNTNNNNNSEGGCSGASGSSNSANSKHTKSSTTKTTTTTTMTTTINTSLKSDSTHSKRSEVLIVKNSSSRKLGGFVDKIANLTKYDSMSHLGRHLIKHNYKAPPTTNATITNATLSTTNTPTAPPPTTAATIHANHHHCTNAHGSCGESSTTSKSCSSTPSSAAVSMNSSAKSSISNLSSTGGLSYTITGTNNITTTNTVVTYVDQHANQSVAPSTINCTTSIAASANNSNSTNTTLKRDNLHNQQCQCYHSTNNLSRPIINIIDQTPSVQTLAPIGSEEKIQDYAPSATFQKSSTYNNVMEHQTNYLNNNNNNNTDQYRTKMDSATPLTANKFHYSASANNLSGGGGGGGGSSTSSQNLAELGQGKTKKTSLAKSFLSVDPNSERYLRKKAKKEAKKAKTRHQENVEQLRKLVNYLHHNSKPLSLSLEAEEIELARSFKLNSQLCDVCLSTAEHPAAIHLANAPYDTDLDGNNVFTTPPARSSAEPSASGILRCHRCKRPIERPESTASHFSDSAITNSDQDSNDDNRPDDPRHQSHEAIKKPKGTIWQNKMREYRHADDIFDKFLAKQKGHIIARAARRGSVFQPKLLFVSFKKDNKLENISQFAKSLPMRSWTSELFLASNESRQLLDPAVKRELLSNYSYEDFRHVITPELSHFSKDIESMLAVTDRRRRSLTTEAKKQRIRFRKFSQVGSDKMWDVDRLQQKNRKIYQERLQVIRSAPNRSSACSDSSGLNFEDKTLEAFDSMVDAAATDSAEHDGSDSQLNDEYDQNSARVDYNLERIDARSLAVEMTLISRDLLLAVNHVELARILLEPHLVDTKNCPNIVILLDFDRRIYHLLITEIISRSQTKDRVEVIAKLIDTAVILNDLKNYFSLNSVISALHSPPVARLNSTWTSLKERYIRKYDSLVRLSNQVMTTYDLTDIDETPTTDDKEKEMNLRQMIDTCCIPQFELIVNQMKKSILECMQTRMNHPTTMQSTPLTSHPNRNLSPNDANERNNNGRARAGAWTNPQNLAVWIDHEINSLIQELETKNAEQKSKKRRSTKWLRGNRRNSSHANDASTQNNDSGVSVITKSLSYASLAPPSTNSPNNGSLWSRLLSKKRKNKSKTNLSRGASPRESINQDESRKSSLSDNNVPSNGSSDPMLKGLASANDLTSTNTTTVTPPRSNQLPTHDNHPRSNPEKQIGGLQQPRPIQQHTTTIEVSAPDNAATTNNTVSKAISRSESYHYLLSDISADNRKFIMNLIQTWLTDVHNKMIATLSALQDSTVYKSSCDARQFLLMQAYKPLKECLVLSLQREPLAKDGVALNQSASDQFSCNSHTDNVLESTRL